MKQPRKAQLRRKIEKLTFALAEAKAEAAHAESLRAFDYQLVDSAQAKLSQVEHWVRDIVDILNRHQPASALLPWELRTIKVPAHTDQMVPPAMPSMYVYEQRDVLEPLSPITLVHLKMFLEEHPEHWHRLVDVEVQDCPGGRHSVIRHAVSREMLSVLCTDRKYFVEHILRHMGAALFEHLNKSK